MRESEWLDRYMKRLGELAPKVTPTDYLEYALNGYRYSDLAPEEEAQLMADDIKRTALAAKPRRRRPKK
jgi:hypothetical protein